MIIHRRAEVTCVGVRGHRPRVSVAPRISARINRDGSVGTRQFDRAVQRFLDRDLGHDGGVIRHVGCISAGGNLTVCPSVAPWAMLPTNSKLRSPNDRVWDRRGFDQILLRDLRAELTIGEQAVGAEDRQRHVMSDACGSFRGEEIATRRFRRTPKRLPPRFKNLGVPLFVLSTVVN